MESTRRRIKTPKGVIFTMIEPRFKISGNGIPIVKDKEIDIIVEQILTDYKPELLSNPQALDVDDFALYYLGLKQHFDYLSHCGYIWGRVVFNNTCKVPVYVPDLGAADYIEAKKGTIIIDNTLLEDRNEYRYRSTMTHECGHWIFHKNMFMLDEQQIYLFEEPKKATIPCRAVDIESNNTERRSLITPHDWIEHHAKYFSAATLMPKKTIELVCTELKSEMRIGHQNIAILNEQLVKNVASIFDVSPTSAQIRIKQLGIDVKRPELISQTFFTLNDLPNRFELIEDL